MSDGHSTPRRRQRPRAAVPRLEIDAIWVGGPRTDAWRELWRRLLAIALEEGDSTEGVPPGHRDGVTRGDSRPRRSGESSPVFDSDGQSRDE